MSDDFNVDSGIVRRCLELAINGNGNVSPNPMVGCVITFADKIIGEGYHSEWGQPHAEVNAIREVIKNGNEHLLGRSTLYVSLEPCSHTGKTPPCIELILKHKIPYVVIGSIDPYPEVNGQGIQILKNAGVKVKAGILKDECDEVNRRFITFHKKHRPYMILKFAQSSNHIIYSREERKISNPYTDQLVHKWRSEEQSILIGTKTAEIDDPLLTVRKWKGKNPIRIVLDRHLRLPSRLRIFNKDAFTLVFNEIEDEVTGNIEKIRIEFDEKMLDSLLIKLYERKILSVLVEGGANLLNQLIEKNLWDEARIITSVKKFYSGVQAPEINGRRLSGFFISDDEINILRPF